MAENLLTSRKTDASNSDVIECLSLEESSQIKQKDGTIWISILCLSTLANAYVTISVFPYAPFMILQLLPPSTSITTESVGWYAGLLASSYMAGRFLAAYPWGHMADSHGRILTLVVTMVLTGTCSLLFGTSSSFKAAMAWRTCLGLASGMISVAKTLVTEYSHGDERLERRAMGLVVGMRSLGLLVGPALGGLLAEPVEQYPSFFENDWVRQRGVFAFLVKFPFVLPNAFAALLCFAGALAAGMFLDETLPLDQRRSIFFLPREFCHYATTLLGRKRRVGTSTPVSESSTLLVSNSQPDYSHLNQDQALRTSSESIWSSQSTRKHLWTQWFFCFASSMVDEAFPLFCLSQVGGLSLNEASIGKILSAAGVLFVVMQFAVFSEFTERFGLYPSMRIGCIVGTIPTLVLPLTLLLPSVPAGAVLGTVMAVTKLMHSLFFTAMTIATNKTVEPSVRGRLNALVLMGNSAGRGLGPLAAGGLCSFSFSGTIVPAQFGSWLIWTVISSLGLMTLLYMRDLSKSSTHTSPVQKIVSIQV